VRIDRDVAAAREVITTLATAGVDFPAVLSQLEIDGVASFASSYDSLLVTVAQRTAAARHEA
jgi:NAD+--asparagine ADP-ribosyltransferase